MPDMLISIVTAIVSNFLQLVIGCLLAMLLYHFATAKRKKFNFSTGGTWIMIGAMSLLGIILPLDIYGIIPIVAAFIAIDFEPSITLPLLFSNVLFNLLVPWNDSSFVWKTGVLRVAIAFGSGVCLGFLLKIFKIKRINLFRMNRLPTFTGKASLQSGLLPIIGECFKKMGIYIICGVTIDLIFSKYFLWELLDLAFNNPNISFLPRYFAGLDVVNPFFLITLSIIRTMLDFTKLSGLVVLFKKKGLILYFGYFILLAILLSVSAFF